MNAVRTGWLVGLSATALLGSACAVANMDALGEADSLPSVSAAFMPEPGWQSVDVELLNTQLRQLLDDGEEVPTSIFHPDARLDPLSKAMLVVLQSESVLPHVRYRLRYARAQVMPEGAGGPLDLDLVDIARFNLGPVQRAELVESLGESVVGTPEMFGEGPDLAWRLIAHPMMGQAADIAYASRRELPEQHGESCFGQPCQELASINETARDWPELEPVEAAQTLPMPEAALLKIGLERMGYIRNEQGQSSWYSPEWPESVMAGQPFIEIVLERGLGQDDVLDLVIHHDQLMDHETKAFWRRLVAFDVEGSVQVMGSSDSELWPRPDW